MFFWYVFLVVQISLQQVFGCYDDVEGQAVDLLDVLLIYLGWAKHSNSCKCGTCQFSTAHGFGEQHYHTPTIPRTLHMLAPEQQCRQVSNRCFWSSEAFGVPKNP